MKLGGLGSLWVLWLVSFLSILIFGVQVFLSTTSLSPDASAYLFAGLVGIMAFVNLKELSRKVAALEEQARTAPHASS